MGSDRLNPITRAEASECVAKARALVAEHHQPVSMTHAELWALLARYQRRLHDLLEVTGRDSAKPARARLAAALCAPDAAGGAR
jgi:hypothetical protein